MLPGVTQKALNGPWCWKDSPHSDGYLTASINLLRFQKVTLLTRVIRVLDLEQFIRRACHSNSQTTIRVNLSIVDGKLLTVIRWYPEWRLNAQQSTAQMNDVKSSRSSKLTESRDQSSGRRHYNRCIAQRWSGRWKALEFNVVLRWSAKRGPAPRDWAALAVTSVTKRLVSARRVAFWRATTIDLAVIGSPFERAARFLLLPFRTGRIDNRFLYIIDGTGQQLRSLAALEWWALLFIERWWCLYPRMGGPRSQREKCDLSLPTLSFWQRLVLLDRCR